jgi:hypothetical protein
MKKMSGKEAVNAAADLIGEQLAVLSMSLAAVSRAVKGGDPETAPSVTLKRKRRPLAAGNSQDDLVFELPASNQMPQENSTRRQQYLRVLTSNALLAVERFLKEHDISDSRTLEIQFLHHVCNAIANENVFRIAPGYIPGASFDGLVIDSSMDGTLLFGDDAIEGFMEFGDAIALLEQLARHLRGVPQLVSGGDAG